MKPDLRVAYEGALGGFPPNGDYRLVEERLEIFYSSENINVYVPLREGINAGVTQAAWELEKFIGAGKTTPALSGTEVTLTFDRGTLRETGTVSGSTGCNRYSTDYATRGDELIFEDVAVTEMACQEPAGVMEQEELYLNFLENVSGYYQKSDGRLHLPISGGRELVFRP